MKDKQAIDSKIKQSQILALKQKGYSYAQIKEATGFSTSTIYKYLHQQKADDDTKDIAKHIERKLTDLEYKIAEKTAEQLFKRVNDDKKINKAKLSEITNTYKTIRELQGKGSIGNQINIQINQNGDTFTIESNND